MSTEWILVAALVVVIAGVLVATCRMTRLADREIKRLERDNRLLRDALSKIVRWEIPPPEQSLEAVPYEQREVRRIAIRALGADTQ